MTLPELTCGYPLPFHRSRTDANLPFLPRRGAAAAAGPTHNMVVPYQSGAARDAHTSEWGWHRPVVWDGRPRQTVGGGEGGGILGGG